MDAKEEPREERRVWEEDLVWSLEALGCGSCREGKGRSSSGLDDMNLLFTQDLQQKRDPKRQQQYLQSMKLVRGRQKATVGHHS